MKRLLINLTSLLLLSSLIGCQNEINCNIDSDLRKSNDSIIALIKDDEGKHQLFSKVNETELNIDSDEVYRLILSKFNSGYSKVYRFTSKDGKYDLISKTHYSFYNDRQIDSLGKEIHRELTYDDWIYVKNLYDNIDFWSLPVTIPNSDYLDGVPYVLEGYKSEKDVCTSRNYHITIRISPSDTTDYKMMCQRIIDLVDE